MNAAFLILIDVQQGFVTPDTAHVPARAAALQHAYPRAAATRFVNPEGSPHRWWIGWTRFDPGSAEVELAFDPRPGLPVYDKTTYSALIPEIKSAIQDSGIEEVHLCGIATDNCVLKTAVDVFEWGLRPVVLLDACGSHGGKEAHDCGVRLLRRFLGEGQVRLPE